MPLGTLSTVDGKPAVRFERRLAHPPEKVWRAVTDPTEMAHWFPAYVETELEIGAPMRFSFGDDKIDMGGKYAEGEILEFDPPKLYVFRWVDELYHFDLEPDGSGCRLVFTYILSGTGTSGDRPSLGRTAPGWDICLDALVARLDGRPAPEIDQAWVLERAERYIEAFGLGEGEVLDRPDGHLVRFERDLVQANEEVWAALTGQDEPVAVGSAPPRRATHGYLTPGRVTEVEPCRVLEYAWLYDGAPAGRVRFELNLQEPLGTRLVVTQVIPSSSADLRATVLAAWQTHLELLFAALHGDDRRPWPAERTAHLERRYAQRLG